MCEKQKAIYEYLKDQYTEQISTFKQIDSRISNRLAILGVFLMVVLQTISWVFKISLESTSTFGFYSLRGIFFALCGSIIIGIYYSIRLLTVKAYLPGVNSAGLLNDITDDDINNEILLNTFIKNYTEAFELNKKYADFREKIGNRYVFVNYVAFILLVVYVSIFCYIRMYDFKQVKKNIGVNIMEKNHSNKSQPAQEPSTPPSTGQTNIQSDPVAAPANTLKTSPHSTAPPVLIKLGENQGKDSGSKTINLSE